MYVHPTNPPPPPKKSQSTSAPLNGNKKTLNGVKICYRTIKIRIITKNRDMWDWDIFDSVF